MKDIRDYLHLYIGTWVEITDVSAYMISQGYEDGKYVLSGEIHHFIMSGECKLQFIELRPLSDMTEEEAVDLVKFEVELHRYAAIEIMAIKSTSIWYIDGEMWHSDGVSECYDKYVQFNALSSNQFQYLLSHHFDLFGLIDSGLAIDKTKLKSP